MYILYIYIHVLYYIHTSISHVQLLCNCLGPESVQEFHCGLLCALTLKSTDMVAYWKW